VMALPQRNVHLEAQKPLQVEIVSGPTGPAAPRPPERDT